MLLHSTLLSGEQVIEEVCTWWEYTEGLYLCGLLMGEGMDAACISYRSASEKHNTYHEWSRAWHSAVNVQFGITCYTDAFLLPFNDQMFDIQIFKFSIYLI